MLAFHSRVGEIGPTPAAKEDPMYDPHVLALPLSFLQTTTVEDVFNEEEFEEDEEEENAASDDPLLATGGVDEVQKQEEFDTQHEKE